MARIVKEIEIEEKRASALFDTGALYTYVARKLLEGVPIRAVEPYKVGLGGKTVEVKEHCAVRGKIEGLDFSCYAIPVDELGKVDGREVDVLIGALTMEQWEISLNPRAKTLDLTALRRREFTEF